MKPYYQDEWVTIYHGDCRDILPTLEKVDLVLTDPPYNIGFTKYASYEDDLEDKDYVAMLALLRGLPCAIMQYPEEMMKYIVPALIEILG